MPSPQLSIIVPVKDDDRVFRLLARLSETPEMQSCEVIVACNGSEQQFVDRIAAALIAFPLTRTSIDSLPNPARAINGAAGVASATRILILDSDCEPCDGYLKSILDATSAHKVMRGKITYTGTNAFSRTTAGWRQCFYDRVAEEGRLYAPNLVIDRDLFLSLGGFVESLRHAYDSEFSDRAMRAGNAAFFLPSAVVIHECHASVRTEMKIWFAYGCGRRYRMNGTRGGDAFRDAVFGDIPWKIVLSDAGNATYALAYLTVRTAGFLYASAI